MLLCELNWGEFNLLSIQRFNPDYYWSRNLKPFKWPWKRLKIIEEVTWMNWSASMRRLWGTKDTKDKVSSLQSLTGKVQVFYRDLPVKYSTLTCFGSVQGLKGQISLKYREIYAFYTGISILYLSSCLCFHNRDFPVLWKTTTTNLLKEGKPCKFDRGKNVNKTGKICNQNRKKVLLKQGKPCNWTTIKL